MLTAAAADIAPHNVAFYLLSREVAKHTKVVQSGQGADEVFAGYHWYPHLATVPADSAAAAYEQVFFDHTPEQLTQLLLPAAQALSRQLDLHRVHC